MKLDFKFWFAPEVFSASAFDLPIISIVSVRAAWTLAVAKNKVYKNCFSWQYSKFPVFLEQSVWVHWGPLKGHFFSVSDNVRPKKINWMFLAKTSQIISKTTV